MRQSLIAFACVSAFVACQNARAGGGGTQDGPVLTQQLPAMNGSALRTTVVEVAYAPGDSSRPHHHPCAVIGYVIAGALRSQSGDGPVTIYHAGQGFYEAPNSVHRVSANASKTDSVRFTATFICDHDTPLSIREAP